MSLEEDYRFRCSDEDCEYDGKKLVWIPTDNGKYRLICPAKILTQTEYNLKFVKFTSNAQLEEAE